MEPTKKIKLATEEEAQKILSQPIPEVLPPQAIDPKLLEKQEEKKKHRKSLRKAGSEVWQDPTLEEWPDNDYRIFVGDLGNEVNDEHLYNAFRKYTSIYKAKVVTDKKTGKTKGYGFVSLGSEDDYIRAMREMNGKYIGNRPIRLKRSTWQKRSLFKH